VSCRLLLKRPAVRKNEHVAILKVYPRAHRDFDFEGIDEIYEYRILLRWTISIEQNFSNYEVWILKHLELSCLVFSTQNDEP
jgi:hypothetical protein